MRTGRPTPPLKITPLEREALEAWARGHDRRLAARAAVVLDAADGGSNKDVASRSGMTKQTVGKWRTRFQANRLEGLYDDPRPGAPRRISDADVARVIRLTREPAPNGSHWTTRSMAQALGMTQTAISRIWRAHRLKPSPDGAAGSGGAHPAGEARAAGNGKTELDGGSARGRTLAAVHKLLRDARALRGTCGLDMDPLLGLAIDAIERALGKGREPSRTTYARANTALRQAKHLLERAEAAARAVQQSLANRDVAATAVAVAMRSVAEGLRGGDRP